MDLARTDLVALLAKVVVMCACWVVLVGGVECAGVVLCCDKVASLGYNNCRTPYRGLGAQEMLSAAPCIEISLQVSLP